MIDSSWITTTGTTLLMVVLSALGIYITLIVLTRITGLRSFSKMSSFDFAITVAFGSVLASTIVAPTPALLTGAFGLVMLYGIQYAVSKSRRLTATVERLVDNEPVLVMAGEQVLSDHLDEVRMSEDDLRSKLRLAGVTHPGQVRAVVFETTGDVSVVKTTDEVDPWVFAGVRGVERLPFMPDTP
jgi:uncharacterized membrane protein YcaP (DUF421 family)